MSQYRRVALITVAVCTKSLSPNALVETKSILDHQGTRDTKQRKTAAVTQ